MPDPDPIETFRGVVGAMGQGPYTYESRRASNDFGDEVMCVLDGNGLCIAIDVEEGDARAVMSALSIARRLADPGMVEKLASVIAKVGGSDPDELAPRSMLCGPHGEQYPWWQAFEEEARAILLQIITGGNENG